MSNSKKQLNRFLEPKEIEKKNVSIIRLLKENKLEEAEVIYNKLIKFNPFNANVHFEFSLAFAKKKLYKESVTQLILAHDIDETFLEKATDKAFKNIPVELLDTIKGKKLSRMWNVISFNQIEPEIDTYGIKLHFKEAFKHKIIPFSTQFNDRVQNYFRLNLTLAEIKKNKISKEKTFFNVNSNSDRTYVHYAQVLLAFKEMSPFLEDVRFFMETETRFVDEIIINEGIFYSYRHFFETSFGDTKLKVLENISTENPLDFQLKKYISKKWVSRAVEELRYFNIEDKESVNTFKKYIKKALFYNKNNAEAYYLKAKYFGKLKEADISDKSYYQKEIKNYKKALKYDANYVKALHSLSIILLSKKQNEDALVYNELALEQNPNHFEALITKGNILFQKQKYNEAILVYKKARDLKTYSIKPYQGLGLCYSWLGENEKAAENNKKAIEINPKKYKILANLGSNLNNLQQFDEALKYLNKSIEINNNYYFSYYCKACVFARTNKPVEAIKMIKKALAIDPNIKKMIENESDFESINNSKEFKIICKN